MITELASLYGLTPRAIRFYEERGLVAASRDRQNCRRFDANARRRLLLISKLRRAGVGLTDIEEILGAGEVGSAAQLACAQGKLAVRRQELEQAMTEVDGLFAELESDSADSAPLRRVS